MNVFPLTITAHPAGIEGIAGVDSSLIEGDHGDPDIGLDFVFGG